MQAYLLALGYPGRASRSTIAGGIVMCIIVVPLVKTFGMVGGALWTTLALLVQLTITSFTVRKIGDRRAHPVGDEELEEDTRQLDPMPGTNILAGPDAWPAPDGEPESRADHPRLSPHSVPPQRRARMERGGALVRRHERAPSASQPGASRMHVHQPAPHPTLLHVRL